MAILDLRMPFVDGLQATIRIKREWPTVRVLVLSGADAFLVKGESGATLLKTIRELAAGP